MKANIALIDLVADNVTQVFSEDDSYAEASPNALIFSERNGAGRWQLWLDFVLNAYKYPNPKYHLIESLTVFEGILEGLSILVSADIINQLTELTQISIYELRTLNEINLTELEQHAWYRTFELSVTDMWLNEDGIVPWLGAQDAQTITVRTLSGN